MNRGTWALASFFAAWVLAAGILALPLVHPREETWLRVEAPSRALRGKPFALVLRLSVPAGPKAKPEAGPGAKLPAAAYLAADLHGFDSSRRYLGFVSGSAQAALVPGRSEYSFELGLPERADLSYVEAVIYLSSLGGWASRVASARLDPVPVESVAFADAELRLKPAYPAAGLSPEDEAARRESLALRIVACLLLAAAAGLWFALRVGPRRMDRGKGLALACAIACLWELAMPEAFFSQLLRGLLRDEGLYSFRRGPQVFLSLAGLAAGLGGAAITLVRSLRSGRQGRGLAWLGLYAYAAISVLGLLSEHDIDSLLAATLWGVPAAQAARLACAAACLAGAAEAWRSRARSPTASSPGTGNA